MTACLITTTTWNPYLNLGSLTLVQVLWYLAGDCRGLCSWSKGCGRSPRHHHIRLLILLFQSRLYRCEVTFLLSLLALLTLASSLFRDQVHGLILFLLNLLLFWGRLYPLMLLWSRYLARNSLGDMGARVVERRLIFFITAQWWLTDLPSRKVELLVKVQNLFLKLSDSRFALALCEIPLLTLAIWDEISNDSVELKDFSLHFLHLRLPFDSLVVLLLSLSI